MDSPHSELVSLAFPTTSRLSIDTLELTDKHIWGYDIQRLTKSGIGDNVKGIAGDPVLRRFDNKNYQVLGIDYSTINPNYITDRTKNLSELLFSSDIDLKNILTKTIPEEFVKLGYLNIPSSVTTFPNDNRFYFSNELGVGDDYEEDKKPAVLQSPLINLPNTYPTNITITRNSDTATSDTSILYDLLRPILVSITSSTTHNELVKAKTLGSSDLFSYPIGRSSPINRLHNQLAISAIMPKVRLNISRVGIANNIRLKSSTISTKYDSMSPWYSIDVQYDQDEELLVDSTSQYMTDKWVPY